MFTFRRQRTGGGSLSDSTTSTGNTSMDSLRSTTSSRQSRCPLEGEEAVSTTIGSSSTSTRHNSTPDVAAFLKHIASHGKSSKAADPIPVQQRHNCGSDKSEVKDQPIAKDVGRARQNRRDSLITEETYQELAIQHDLERKRSRRAGSMSRCESSVKHRRMGSKASEIPLKSQWTQE